MPFAILRFEKRRGGTATAIEKHHEREKEAYKSNPDIDAGKVRHNYHIKEPQNRYYYEVQSRIEAAMQSSARQYQMGLSNKLCITCRLFDRPFFV